jgi:DUF218 domain-containing protein
VSVAPVLCADPERLVRALLANRELARPGSRDLLVLRAPADVSGGTREVVFVGDGVAPVHERLTVVRAGVGPDHVAIVLGHREPGVSAEHKASHESFERLHRAAQIVRRVPTRAVILTGYTSTGGLTEAEQMALAWSSPDVPVLLEEAGRNTAENATRSLPLVLALGGIRRVSVVTSAWHLRAPYFFAPYRRYGLQVDNRREWRGGDFLRMTLDELRKAPRAPAERRRAWAAAP